ncbi:phage integrase family protein [Mycolicibacterium neworleansense]|uniref:Phage integrase family protein n=1 Tax=Mycolicibacterium neworleansense TaxID=146018 RepID=A0A0H5RX75_9MYCO|nr:phage integrase family protein [Mycolicibacterium neworleansense]
MPPSDGGALSKPGRTSPGPQPYSLASESSLLESSGGRISWDCRDCGLGAVRFHDLRHTFATMNLSAGEHYMQVSKWLGHSTFVLTLTTYADYINEDEQVAPKVGAERWSLPTSSG